MVEHLTADQEVPSSNLGAPWMLFFLLLFLLCFALLVFFLFCFCFFLDVTC